MRKALFILFGIGIAISLNAQGIYNSGVHIVSQGNSYWVLSGGDFTLTSGTATSIANLTIHDNTTLTIGNNLTVTNDLGLTSGTLLVNGKTLTVAGAITGSGTLTGSISSNLIIGGTAGSLNFTQSNAASRSLKDFTLSAAATATLGNPLEIVAGEAPGTLVVNSGATLTTAGNLTLKSDIAGTASVGISTGTISGTAMVERFIPNNNFRSWRLLSVPTYGNGQTIRQAWQEGAVNPNPWDNNLSGYGTQITSVGTEAAVQAAGFDDDTPNPSMLSYNGSALTGVPTTNAAIATNKGYFLYVRGDRSINENISTTTNIATILRTNGNLYQGTQTSATVLANNYGLVGNPFASAIDFGLLTKTNVNNCFYIWDSKIHSGNSLGVYQTFSSVNDFKPLLDGGSYSTSTGNTSIQSGQAFFVQSSGLAGTVTIPESSKIASTGTPGYKTSAELIKIDSRLYSIASATTMADGNVVVFDATYSNAVDGNDATKFSNAGENLGILRDGQTLVVEARQPATTADTIFFKMWNMQPHAYQLELIPQNLGTQNLTAKLEDRYLNSSSTVNLSDTTRVDFSVDATPASYASNRFRIVFTSAVILPVNFISVSASRKTANVLINWKVGNELNIHHYEVERSTDGRNYSKAVTAVATGITAYSLLDANAPNSSLFYRVKAVSITGEIKYSGVVKLSAENVKPGYAVVPNPIEGTELNLQFKNQVAGKYQLKLLSNAGQQISSTEVNHTGGNGTQTIQIPTGLARGAYQLEIISADKTSSTEAVFINNK